MPEEVNRIMVDSISTKLFCTEESAHSNLKQKNAHLVGNTAIDTLHIVQDRLWDVVNHDSYYLCTLHRPFNVDIPDRLNSILKKLNSLDKKVIIPTHPRLNKNIIDKSLYTNIKFIDPLGYIDFISYIRGCSGVITDSGGVQCEAAFFKKVTLTLRPSTEHLITLSHGNQLGNIEDIIPFTFKNIIINELPFEWDGNASKRIAEIIG